MIKLKKSNRKYKKYFVEIDNKKIHFGDDRYLDYTSHKDKKRKENYISRHSKNENWNDINTPGFWAKNLLWNKPTLEESILDIEKRFNVKILT